MADFGPPCRFRRSFRSPAGCRTSDRESDRILRVAGAAIHATPRNAFHVRCRPCPIHRQCAALDVSMKRRKRPLPYRRCVAVLHRIPMHVVDVPPQCDLVAERPLPEATLPDAPFAPLDACLGTIFTRRQPATESGFDPSPPPGIVTITLRQAPYAVQMLRQHHDRDHLEGLGQPGRTERRPQIVDVLDKQTPPAFQQIHGEEERAARHVFAAIAGHGPACRHPPSLDIGKVRATHRNPPQRMHRPRKVRQGRTLRGLGRAPARRNMRVTGLITAPSVNVAASRANGPRLTVINGNGTDGGSNLYRR